MPEMNGEFYVGYQPKAAPGIGRRVRQVVGVLLGLGLSVGLLLMRTQEPFAEATFEFGVTKRYEGRLIERPFPMLLTKDQLYLLVGEGKHGAGPLVVGEDGQAVTLEGTLISRGAMRALEVKSDSVRSRGEATVVAPLSMALGRVTLTGEIVDTKCYLGVMNPGAGKVHRECAARCLSGGMPPGLRVRDEAGREQTVLLEGVAGRELLEVVAERVSATGELRREGSVLVLRVSGRSALKRE